MINTELACRGNIISLSENAGRIIRMKWRSLFVCKWEIDYIYLERSNEQDTHTHTQMRASGHHTAVFLSVAEERNNRRDRRRGREREMGLGAASSSMAHLSRIF